MAKKTKKPKLVREIPTHVDRKRNRDTSSGKFVSARAAPKRAKRS